MWNFVVGELARKDTKEHGVRRMSRKTLLSLLDLELEEYMQLAGAIGLTLYINIIFKQQYLTKMSPEAFPDQIKKSAQ